MQRQVYILSLFVIELRFFSKYFYWITLLIYMTAVSYASVFWFAWHIDF